MRQFAINSQTGGQYSPVASKSVGGDHLVQASHLGRRSVSKVDPKAMRALGVMILAFGLILAILGSILWGVGAGVHNHACLNAGITFFSLGLAVSFVGGVRACKKGN